MDTWDSMMKKRRGMATDTKAMKMKRREGTKNSNEGCAKSSTGNSNYASRTPKLIIRMLPLLGGKQTLTFHLPGTLRCRIHQSTLTSLQSNPLTMEIA